MRVVVVFGPLRVSRDFVDYPYFANLGAAQAAAVLVERGFDVALVDALAIPGAGLAPDADDASYIRLGASVDETADAVIAAGPADLLLVAYTPFHRPPARDPALAGLLARLRPRHAGPILLADLYQSGQHYVDAPVSSVRAAYPEIDHYEKYEIEAKLDALVRALVEGREPPVGPIGSGQPPQLDALPLPAWHLVDVPAYFAFLDRVARDLGRGGFAFPFDGGSLPMVSSRGCPYRCAHCSSNPGLPAGRPKTQRRHSLAYLERALARLKQLGARRVHLLDELINVDEAHFDGLLALLADLDLRYEIPNGMRADYLEPRHLAAMKDRVTTVSVSAESGVQRVVDEVVGKRLDLGKITDAAREGRRAGVRVLVHFIIGMPGETRAEMNRTLEYAAWLAEEFGAEPAVQFATPLPGTRLHGEAVKRHLPVEAADYGPRFQQLPTITGDFGGEVLTARELVLMRQAFERRLLASANPEKIIVNVTYRCNNKCSFCAVGTRDGYDGDLAMQREHLALWHARGVRLLDIDGGEPTLYEGLIPLVRYARAVGYRKINVTTNGRRLIYPDYARALVTSGLTSILVSIHGPDRATHAREVMVLEAFDQTVAGLRNATRLRDALGLGREVEIGVNITLTEGNYRRLAEVAELALDAGAPWLNVQFLTPFGRATDRVAPDTQAAANVTMEVIDRFKDRMRLQVINLPPCFMPGYEAWNVGDVGKLDRRMVFVNNEDVNLARYLAERRTKKPVCDACPHAVACGGFYELDDVPEPRWRIDPKDIVRLPQLPSLRARE